ncbi:MAG TPA: response regulator [Dehalococcoidia bacterium]|nr:response regulator [Dehalococcoidia bacterium]
MGNILIIEDQEALGMLYKSVLRQFNHNVVVATDGQAGVDAARKSAPDLVILDLMLPGMPGVEVALKLKQLGVLPTAPLIITTAVSDGDASAIAQSLGAASVLAKPFDITSLITTVRNVLANPRRRLPVAG